MVQPSEILLRDDSGSLSACGPLLVHRLYTHPKLDHFERGIQVARQRLARGLSPFMYLLAIPPHERSLPPAYVIPAFGRVAREFAPQVAAAVVLVEPEVGALGAVIRAAVSTHLLLLRRKEVAVKASFSEALAWLVANAPADLPAGPLRPDHVSALWRVVAQPLPTAVDERPSAAGTAAAPQSAPRAVRANAQAAAAETAPRAPKGGPP